MLASVAEIYEATARRLKPKYPPTVAECAREHVFLKGGTGGLARWSARTTPYMVEAMNAVVERQYDACVFCGSAQSGKTQALVDCLIAYIMLWDDADLLLVEKKQRSAQTFEKQRLSRMIQNSPALRERLTPCLSDDATFTKTLRGGQILQLAWPTKNELAGKSIKTVIITDVDRMMEDLGGEGSPYDLGKRRNRKYMSRAITVAESSPGNEILDPEWTPSAAAPHEAPPAHGIFGLYNLGDRRRYYWACLNCGEFWMQPPGPEGFKYSFERDSNGEMLPSVHPEITVDCPRCGHQHREEDRVKLAADNNFLWVPEGCRIERGEVVGEARRSGLASWWLPGAAAAYQSWNTLLTDYARAMCRFQTSGTTGPLKTSLMQDSAAPYVSPARRTSTDLNMLEARTEDWARRTVPPQVRYLVSSVDIQSQRFVTQVHGFGESQECWLIDRFDIRESARTYYSGGKQEHAPVNPATYLEDWNLITERVLSRTYRLADDSGRRMRVVCAILDSAGMPGVTLGAYQYYRLVAAQGWGDETVFAQIYPTFVPSRSNIFVYISAEYGILPGTCHTGINIAYFSRMAGLN